MDGPFSTFQVIRLPYLVILQKDWSKKNRQKLYATHSLCYHGSPVGGAQVLC